MASGLILAGRYQLKEQLGVGGMGSVWTAYDQNLGADVAIKLIDSSLANSPDALERFRREARAAAAIRSTYVVQILDYGVDNDTPFIAMELLKGESLAHRLEGVGTLSPEETGHLLGHVGRALALAHDNGIVHRDLKPENVFLVREGNEDVGKVLDFGIARQVALGEQTTLKTQAGTILGTPYYMSPEQATGQPVDNQSDIWAFGVIAYECLVGRRAVDGDSIGAIFHAVCMAELPVPSRVGVVPPNFDEWFSRAVARDKSQRFGSIRQAADELRTLCGCTSTRTLALNLSKPNSAASIQRATDIVNSATLAVSASTHTVLEQPKRKSWLPWLSLAGLALAGFGITLGWYLSRSHQVRLDLPKPPALSESPSSPPFAGNVLGGSAALGAVSPSSPSSGNVGAPPFASGSSVGVGGPSVPLKKPEGSSSAGATTGSHRAGAKTSKSQTNKPHRVRNAAGF